MISNPLKHSIILQNTWCLEFVMLVSYKHNILQKFPISPKQYFVKKEREVKR